MDKFDRDMMEMMEQDANYNPQSVPEEHDYSHDQMSPSEVREFNEHMKWFRKYGLTVKVETDVKSQIEEGIKPLVQAVNRLQRDIEESKNKAINDLKTEIPSIVKKGANDIDIKGIIKNSNDQIKVELWLWRIIIFIVAACAIPYYASKLFVDLHTQYGEIVTNVIIWIAVLIFLCAIFYWIGTLNRDKF